jgi:TolB-like protein/DNA-binding winged helix-turn-helix (wHTH) protein
MVDLSQESQFRIGTLEVQPAGLRAAWPGGDESVQPLVMQVLIVLFRARGAVVSRDTLVQSCWDGRIVDDNAVSRIISLLRGLGSRSGAFDLETIPKIGYRLAATGETLAPAPGEAPSEKPRPDRRRVLVAGAVLGAGALAAGIVIRRRLISAPHQITVAVMPFDDMRAHPSSDFLAQGLARELRNALSRMAGLRVVSDASSFQLVGLKDAEVGRRLGADLLIKGSVGQSAADIRTTTELVDAKSGLQLWADTHDSRGGDLFKLQDELTGATIQALIDRLPASRLRQPPPQRRRDPEVFRLMLGANDLLEQTRALQMKGLNAEAQAAADQAQDLVHKALAIDPNDPAALVAQATLVRNGWGRELAGQPLSVAERGAQAAVLLRSALAADPNDPSALASLADYLRRLEWNWTDAAALFKRALAIDPNHLEAHWGYAYQVSMLGDGLEGLAHAKALMRLDPETEWRRLALPRMYLTVGDMVRAKSLYDHEFAANPGNLFLIRELYIVALTNNDADALAKLPGRMRAQLPPAELQRPDVVALLARAAAASEALAGRPAGLLKLVDADVADYDAKLAGTGTQQGRASVDLLFIYAMEYAWAGAAAQSAPLLDRALAGHSTYWPPTLPYGPSQFPAKVRELPAFQAAWRSDPKRAEIVRLRLDALQRGRMAGFLPDGRKVTPRVPPNVEDPLG